MSRKDSPLSVGTRVTAYSFDPNDLTIFGFDTEHPAEHPLVDDDMDRLNELDKDMVANIKHRGVIEPIEVTVVDDAVVVVNGRRRVVHAREANAERVKEGLEPWKIKAVTMRGGENSIEHKLTAISANSFRQNHGPIAEARKVAQLINAGQSHEEIANAFGFSVGTVTNRLNLLDLSAKVQRAVEKGQVSAMAALALKDLDKSEQDEKVKVIIEETKANGGSKRGQASRAQELANPDKQVKPSTAKLRKMMGTDEFAELSEDVQRVIRWVVGDLKTPSTIEGMSAAWKAATAPKEKKGKKAPPRVSE